MTLHICLDIKCYKQISIYSIVLKSKALETIWKSRTERLVTWEGALVRGNPTRYSASSGRTELQTGRGLHQIHCLVHTRVCKDIHTHSRMCTRRVKQHKNICSYCMCTEHSLLIYIKNNNSYLIVRGERQWIRNRNRRFLEFPMWLSSNGPK